ncbi:DUF1304 domain-containing protein [Paraglaciecola aestuariivivens]
MKFWAGFMTFLVAALHMGFMVLEMFYWDHPLGHSIFSLTPEMAAATELLAMNQGLYNGFLGFGLLWALLSGNQSLKVFLLICVAVAGVFGGLTVNLNIVYVQALPGLLALLFVVKAKRRQAGETRLFS